MSQSHVCDGQQRFLLGVFVCTITLILITGIIIAYAQAAQHLFVHTQKKIRISPDEAHNENIVRFFNAQNRPRDVATAFTQCVNNVG